MEKWLITGSRYWQPVATIEKHLAELLEERRAKPWEVLVIHGGARGVDESAEVACTHLGIHSARIDARWGTYRRSAGPRRNGIMAALEPDLCLAYHENIGESSGTLDMVKKMEKAGVQVRIWDGGRWTYVYAGALTIEAVIAGAVGT